MEEVLHDLRFALRSLRNNPRFTAIAILTLAIGIGANTTIFSVVNGVLLRELPYDSPDELIRLQTEMLDGRSTGGGVSVIEAHALRTDEFPSVTHVTHFVQYEMTVLDADGRPIRTNSYGVTEQFFETFGVPLFLGSGFEQLHFEPAGEGGSENMRVIVGYELWRDVLGADPNIVGSTLETTEFPMPVAGVAPPGFSYPAGANIWFTLPHTPAGGPRSQAVARITGGVPYERVQSELDILASRLAEERPGTNSGRGFAFVSLSEDIVGDLRSTLFILLGATLTLLLIACVNVANLLLSRGAARSKEVALRVALGAGRWRVVRQLLTESLVLAGAGAALGVAGAWISLTGLARLDPTNLPRLNEVGIDGTVLLFTVAVTGLAGLFFGLAPAMRLVATDIRSLLGEGARGSSAGPMQGRILRGLVTGQMALAVALVIGAGLLVRSYARLQAVDGGFDASDVLVVDVSLPWGESEDPKTIEPFYREVAERIRDLPGVLTVGGASTAPMGDQLDGLTGYYVEGREIPANGEGERLRARKVLPGYFEAMDIELVSGRLLTDFDVLENPGVAVINEAAADLFFPGQNPLGERIMSFAENVSERGGPFGWNAKLEYEVVGVVRDTRLAALDRPDDPALIRPLSQHPWRRMMLTVETSEPPAELIAAVREAVWDVNPTISLQLFTQEELVSRSMAQDRLGMLMLLMFGLSALGLASVGIYGVISNAVAERTAELAIRASLGLEPRGMLTLMLRHGASMTAAGLVVGIAFAFIGRSLIAQQLYEVSASDPLVFVGVPIFLAAVSTVAVLIPALRVTSIDLAHTLRSE